MLAEVWLHVAGGGVMLSYWFGEKGGLALWAVDSFHVPRASSKVSVLGERAHAGDLSTVRAS